MILKKVISGGQKGADLAGLSAAKAFFIDTGGTAAKNFMTENGPYLQLKTFGLIEGGNYRERTWKNVQDSDGTIRFAVDFSSPGERCTLNAIGHFNKLHFDVNLLEPILCSDVVIWIMKYQIQTLNVAGNREGTTELEVFKNVFNYLCAVFGMLNIYT